MKDMEKGPVFNTREKIDPYIVALLNKDFNSLESEELSTLATLSRDVDYKKIKLDDPELRKKLEEFKRLDIEGVLQLRVLPNPGMEGTAFYVYSKVNEMVKELTKNRVWITLVEVRENEKNSAIFTP